MRVYAFSLLVLSTLAGRAEAQSVPITYLAALQQALSNRPEVEMDRAGRAMADARVGEAKGAFLPTLSAFSTLRRITLHNDFSPIQVNVHYAGQNVPVTVRNSVPPYELSTGLDLRYNLYAGGGDLARLDSAHASRRVADADTQLTRRRLAEEVTGTYWAMVKAKVDGGRIRRALDRARTEAQIAGVQYQQGDLAQVEAEERALAVKVREAEWQRSERALADLIRRYLRAVGMDGTPEAVQALRQTTALDEAHGIDGLDPATLVASLHLGTAAQVDRERAELETASAAIVAARADDKPTLDFFVRHNGIGRSASGFDNALGQYGRDATYVGLQVSWRWFDGFRAESRLNHALATVAKQRAIVELVQRDAELEWQARASRVDDAKDKLALAQQQVALAEAQLAVARTRLETKLGSGTQAQAAANVLADARDSLTSLKIDAFVASVEALLATSASARAQ